MRQNQHSARAIKFNDRHARRQAAKSLAYKKWRRQNNRSRQGQPRPKHGGISRATESKKVIAPTVLSVLNNANGCFKMVSELEELRKNKKQTYVVLRDVQDIDYGAIVLLLATMIRFRSTGVPFNGDKPLDNAVNHALRDSGFFDHLYQSIRDQERYELAANQHGSIVTHARKVVDAELSSKIVETAACSIWGDARRCQGVQRVLVELMHNTNNHASPVRKGEKHWWLSVRNNPDTNRSRFSFVDFGVGVISSLLNKAPGNKWYNWRAKLAQRHKFSNNKELLELVLSGSLHEVVRGPKYRGKGLPGIASAVRRNQVSDLYVITNDVFYNVGRGEVRSLEFPFEGTFVSWEVGRNNDSCK